MNYISDISPTRPQFDFITSTAAFPAFVAGFGAGKTQALIYRAILGKLQNPKQDRGFYEPTYDLIRTIAFPRFEETLSSMGLNYRLYKSPLNYLDLFAFGKIIFRSMDTPHRIIGYEHADADIDELDTLKLQDAEKVFRMVMSRNRQKKQDGTRNTIGVGTTPEGFRFVYEKWAKSLSSDYPIIKAPTHSNPHLPADYVDNLKESFPEKQLQAYINGEFVNMTAGTVYYTFDRSLHGSHEIARDGEELLVGMDFNVYNMAATVGVYRDGKLHLVDEFTKLKDTPEMIYEIQKKYPKSVVTVYPDASGGNASSKSASESDISLLKQAGFFIRVNKKNPLVKDRINSTNNAFEKNLVFINLKMCKTTASCLEQQAYNGGVPDKTTGLDHQNDATTYLICYEFPINRSWI